MKTLVEAHAVVAQASLPVVVSQASSLQCLVASLAALACMGIPASAQLDRLLAPVDKAVASVSAASSSDHLVLTAEMLTTELEKELTARLSLAGELKLALAQPWQPVKLPAEDFAVVITEVPVGGIGGTFYIRAKATSGGALVGDWQLPLRAQLLQDVWVASTRLDRGQPLDRSVLGVQKIDVLRERLPLIPAEVDPANFDLTQSVAAGRPLTRRDLAERPVIRKGQVVEVIARQGMLAVSTKALALESGAAGDLIKLRNIESRREFSGQILNENKVQVHF